jgi:hypothetical protein
MMTKCASVRKVFNENHFPFVLEESFHHQIVFDSKKRFFFAEIKLICCRFSLLFQSKHGSKFTLNFPQAKLKFVK